MACEIKKQNLQLVEEGSWMYSLPSWEFEEVISVESICWMYTNFQIVSNKTIKFDSDLPCECAPICMSYIVKQNKCVVDNSCC